MIVDSESKHFLIPIKVGGHRINIPIFVAVIIKQVIYGKANV